MASISDLLPDWHGVRDHLWAELGILVMTSAITWGLARYKNASPSKQLACFMATEFLIGLSGAAAIGRFGLVAGIWGVIALLLPVAALFALDRRLKHDLAEPASPIQSTTLPVPPPEVHISLGSHWNPTLSSDADPSWPPLPADGILHDFQTAETLEELRAKLRVRMMSPAHNELPIRELPNGIFGYAPVLNFTSRSFIYLAGQKINDKDWLLVPDSLVLHRTPAPASGIISLMNDIEVIKSEQGDVYLVAFVPDEAFISLLKPGRADRVTTVLRLNPRPEGDHPVAIPRERLCSWRNRTLENGAAIVDTTIR